MLVRILGLIFAFSFCASGVFAQYNSPGVVIGTGFWDYQANGAIGKRMAIDENGNYHVVFISAEYFTSNPPTNPYRGSFYSFSYDGQIWGKDDGTGTQTITPGWERIESFRGGFPSLDFYRNNSVNLLGGSAVVVSHLQDPNFNDDFRTVVNIDLLSGQGLWQKANTPLVPNLPIGDGQPIWPSCAVGSNDKLHVFGTLNVADQATSPNSLYHTSLSDPLLTNFAPYQLMDSLAGVNVLTDADAKVFVSDGADRLILVYFHASGSSFQDTTLASNALYKFESLDNGATWSFDNVSDDTPLNFVNSQAPEDFEWRAFNHFDVTMDLQGNPHYTYVEHKTTSAGSYFPNAYRLVYQNGTTGSKNQIFAYDDYTDSGTFGKIGGTVFEDGSSWNNPTIAPSGADLGGRFQQIISTPQLGFDDNGAMHVIFTGYPAGDIDWGNMPNGDSANAQVHGDIFHTMSVDGGNYWGFYSSPSIYPEFENITNSLGTDEKYAMIPQARMESGFVEVAFETDDFAGFYNYPFILPFAVQTDYHFYKHQNGTGTIYTLNLGDVDENKTLVKKDFSLSQNYPNPFNPSTSINYDLGISNYKNSKLVILNILGEEVKEYILTESKGTIVWDGTDNLGKPVSSGNYFYQLVGNNFSETKKMTLLK